MSTATPSAPSAENEFEWLFDYIVTFLKSPPWTVPINTFIDEHCIIFDNEEENKFVHTDCHNTFKSLIDLLLSTNLSVIGVSEEQFVSACSHGQQSKHELTQLVFGQILAVDDFLIFKRLMCKRNRELEIEAVTLLQDFGPHSKDEAELQLELALALSQQEAADGGRKKGGGKESEAETEAALKASIAEQERLGREAAREQAELEHAIAMSLALEKERLRLMQLSIEADKAAEAAAKAAKTANSSTTAPVITVPTLTTAQIAAVAHLSPIPPATTSTPAPTTTTPQPTSTSTSASASSSLRSLPALVPLKPVPSVAASVSLQSTTQQSNPQKSSSGGLAPKQLIDVSKKCTPPNISSTSSTLLGASSGSLNDVELKRRQEFLRSQREIFLKKKNAEREEQLRAFESEKNQAPARPQVALPVALIPSPSSTSPSTSSSTSSITDDGKRNAMRDALAARLKADMIVVERKNAAMSSSSGLSKSNELIANLARLEEVKKVQEQAKTKAAELMAAREKETNLQQRHLEALHGGKGVNAAEHNYQL